MSTEEKSGTLSHQTGVNPKGEPFIQLILCGKPTGDEFIAQMSPEQCRDHALAMLAAAEAAEQDAFMVNFFMEQLGASREHAGMVLMDFRKWREERSGIKTGQKLVPDKGFHKA